MAITYRPEIDGLRAIAVTSVVLYHAGVGNAGFVGVDVFFVISGYLITSLLLHEHEVTGKLDLMSFYARRVRRIVPAAIAVVLATIAASFLLLPAPAFTHAANSAGAAVVFGANVFFQFASGGYFDGRSEEMPLLHLWSLSVEEQFYFVWPALLLAMLRWKSRWLIRSLVLLGVASFALAEWLIVVDPEAAFYQMPARFWELAAGGVIAGAPVRALPRYFAPAGITLTLAACVFPMGHFPGYGALPAVVGAGMIIAAVHGGATNALLASGPFVRIGLVSYSLYLWHWPLLALYRATSIGEGSQAVRLQLCAVALLLAFASYRYIEQPFRKARGRKGRTIAIGAALSMCLAIGACAWGIVTERGAPVSDRPLRRCHSMGTDPVAIKCAPVAGTRVAIWGDSMAYAWSPMAWTLDAKAAAFSRDACGPFLGNVEPTREGASCKIFNDKVATNLNGLDTLYLVARWQPNPARFAGLERTLAAVAGKVGRVYIIGPTPEMRDDATRCIAKGKPESCAVSRAEFETKTGQLLTQLRALAARHPKVEVIDPSEQFCSATSCGPLKEGLQLYWDSHHITLQAATNFAQGIDTRSGTRVGTDSR